MTGQKLIVGMALFVWLSTGLTAEQLLSPVKLRRAALQYERGDKGKPNYGKAYRLYCLAAALDDRQAMYRLGWMYFNGRGVKRHKGVALGWFRRAAKRGDRYAVQMVRRFIAVKPRRDPLCPITKDPKRMNRRAVLAWARLLGRTFHVDPLLVLAVIKTESNFNPSAMSPKMAYGLMQLMPDTAKRFGVNRLSPVENMIGGVLYLRWLLKHFRGNVRLALAAYNAGEQAVHRYHGVPPYRETRRYVKRILADYHRLHHPVPKPVAF